MQRYILVAPKIPTRKRASKQTITLFKSSMFYNNAFDMVGETLLHPCPANKVFLSVCVYGCVCIWSIIIHTHAHTHTHTHKSTHKTKRRRRCCKPWASALHRAPIPP